MLSQLYLIYKLLEYKFVRYFSHIIQINFRFLVLIIIIFIYIKCLFVDIDIIFLEYSYFDLSRSCKKSKVLIFGLIPFLYLKFHFNIFKRFKQLIARYKGIVQVFKKCIPKRLIRRMQFHKSFLLYILQVFFSGCNILAEEE